MYPLTMREMIGDPAGDLFLDRVTRNDVSQLTPGPHVTIVDYISMSCRGGLPEAALRLQGRSHRAWAKGYVEELISRDIASAGGDPDPSKLAHHVHALAAVSGCVVEETTLFDATGVGRRTASRYEALLQAVFFCDQVRAWRSNHLARLVSMPKRFVLDSGLLVATLNASETTVLKDPQLLGRVLETFVAMQLRPELSVCDTHPSLHHLRDQGGRREIDFILDYGQGQLVGLEVKATASPDTTDVRHLVWLRDKLGDSFTCGVLLHTGKHSFKLSDRIYAAPISTIWA